MLKSPKPLLVLKLTVILLTVAMLHVSAKGISQTVSFSGSDVPLEKVFDAVKTQTGFVFFYDVDILKKSAPVTLNVKNVPLEDFLRLAFAKTPLKYSIQNHAIIVTLRDIDTEIPPDNITISGRIVDVDGNPLAGATLAVKTESGMTSVMSDADGKFSMTTKPGTVIIVSYVGYKTYTFKATQQTRNISISLSHSTDNMNEVSVTTGFQTIAKERSTGAFSRVEGEEIQQKSVSINVIDRLEGLVPGLAVNNGQGADKFLIRGVNSVNANRAPLYVLDGVPIAYGDVSTLVNPNDVESIQVLRDAMATSIWGSQAANGVIVITTKKGKAQGHIKVQYNGFISFKGLPDYSYQKMMSPKQFITAAQEVFDPSTFPYSYVTTISPNYELPVVFPHEQVLYDLSNGIISQGVANARLDSLASLNNRSQIEHNLMQPAMLSNHSVSFSGGSPFYSFYGSLNYTNTKNIDRSDINNYMVDFKQIFSFTPGIKLDITTNLSQQSTTLFIVPDLPTLNTYLPYAMFSDAKGNPLSQSYLQLYSGYQQTAEQQSGINLDYVPLKESAFAPNSNSTLSARLNAGLTIKLWRSLTFEGRYQYQSAANDGYTYYDQNSYLTRREVVNFTEPGPVYNLPNQGGDYLTSGGTNTAWYVRNQLNYNEAWKDNELTMLLGTDVRDNTIKSNSKTIRGYDDQTLTYLPYNELAMQQGIYDPIIPNYFSSSVLSSPTFSASQIETRFFSLYGNFAYAFKKKYNLNGSIRMDQSNLFGANISQQYKPIWSVGSSWLISNEPFFEKKLVNALKLRLTYGIAGNSPNPGSGGPYDIIQPQQSPFYQGLALGYSILLPSNKQLTWESTATLNAGVDVGLLENRVTFSVDVYSKKTDNLLGYAPFDPTNGWSNGYVNLGNIENKGVELAVVSQNIVGKNFSWMTRLNFAYNHNEIVKLGQTVPLTAEGKLSSNGFVEGYSAYSLFDLKWAGLDNQGNPQVYTQKGQKIGMASDLSLDDVHYAGTTQPQYYGGMTNTFRYRAFELSCLIIYNLGYQMRSYTNTYFSGRLTTNISTYFEDRWKNPGDENKTNVPKYISDPNVDAATRSIEFYGDADINVESASYIKMRDITLTYTLPVSWISRMSMDNVQVYTQMNNLMLWTANHQGIDPEYYNAQGGPGGYGQTSNGGTGQLIGTPPSAMPDKMKPFWTFGLRVIFK